MADQLLIGEQDLYNLVRTLSGFDWNQVSKDEIRALANDMQWQFSDNGMAIDCSNKKDQIVLLASIEDDLVSWLALFICWWDKNGEYDETPGYIAQEDRTQFDQIFQDFIYLLNASAGQPLQKDDNFVQDFSRVVWGFDHSIMQLYQAQQDEFSGVEMCVSFRPWRDKNTLPDPW